MRTMRLSIVASLPLLIAPLAIFAAGCGHSEQGTVGQPVPTALRSQRRLAYKLATPVAITAQPDRSFAVGLPHELRKHVTHDMRELGLDVDRDETAGHDLSVHLSVSVQAVGRLSRARAAMYVISSDGQMLEQIDSDEIVEAPDRIGAALARDLVARLARSPRPAEYADAIYGHRLRPLRDTVGRHATGRTSYGDGMPPQEALNLANKYGVYDTTLRGRTELSPPVEAPAPARAAARDDIQRGQALLADGRPRDAYAAFEQAFLQDDEAEPLFGLAESLLRAGARQDALIFYRAYLRQAEPGSALAARAVAQMGAIEKAPAAPKP
jgi:tetratricopeptide (TPR) repeat protein